MFVIVLGVDPHKSATPLRWISCQPASGRDPDRGETGGLPQGADLGQACDDAPVTEREPAWYESCASELLEPRGDRWLHVEAVGRCAEKVAFGSLPLEDRLVLIAAAWLHDIGYAPQIALTGFHPLDGARYLRTIGADERIVALVAHHSCARFEAELRGLGRALDEFEREEGAVADALIYADMVTGPRGQPLTVDQRLANIFERYAEGSVVHTAISQASGELRAAVLRTGIRLAPHETRGTN